MAFYTDRSIAEVAAKNNLVDVASSYISLKRNGSDYVARCPFHNEKTPSFHINEDKQLFYCFGCGAGGNIFDFVERIENLDFVDALELLAQRSGVSLEKRSERSSYLKENDYHEKCKRLYEINKAAARHFVDNLLLPDSKTAQEYAKKRGITGEALRSFGLGFAKDEWTELTDFLKKSGYSEEDIIEAGLAVKNEKNRVYDKFRNRLMFPVIDIRGNVIAFSGRALGDDKAKYMNSPETPVFVKGKNLFGLNLAKKYSKDSGVILVEGNMDVVSLYSRGFKNVVAGLGTAFTPEQAQLLKRYSREVYVCYDNDEAGKKAALKNIEVLTAYENRVKVIEITGAKDPDEYILKMGPDNFKGLIKSAIPVLSYKLRIIKEKYDLTDETAKIDFVYEASKMLSEVDSSVEREIYVRNIARETEISEKAIFTEINKLMAKNQKSAEIKVKRPNLAREMTPKSNDFLEKKLMGGQNMNTYKSERMLLNLVFYNKTALNEAILAGGEELFSSQLNKRLFNIIADFRKEDFSGTASEMLSKTEEQFKKSMTAVLFTEFNMDDVKMASTDVIKKLKGEQMKIRIDSLVKEGNMAEAMRLIKIQKEGGSL